MRCTQGRIGTSADARVRWQLQGPAGEGQGARRNEPSAAVGGTCIQRAPVAALVPAWLRLQRSGGLFTVGTRQVNAVAKRWGTPASRSAELRMRGR